MGCVGDTGLPEGLTIIDAERSLRRAVPQRHKSYRIKHGQLPAIGSVSLNQVERLSLSSRHWRNQAPSNLHLLKPGLGKAFTRGGGNHQIIGCGLGHAQLAVTKDEAQIRNTQASKVGSGLLMQTPDAFDGHHLAKQTSEYSRLISTARSDFEHAGSGPRCSFRGAAKSSIMRATVNGREMVCAWPMGSATSS